MNEVPHPHPGWPLASGTSGHDVRVDRTLSGVNDYGAP
jgi:hypothetical protein